jgi:type I site-specific restriction endonuclease
VTADDGGLGEQYLCDFQDNEKTIPTILTTSQKLSPGVDARNIRNIILSLLNTGCRLEWIRSRTLQIISR